MSYGIQLQKNETYMKFYPNVIAAAKKVVYISEDDILINISDIFNFFIFFRLIFLTGIADKISSYMASINPSRNSMASTFSLQTIVNRRAARKAVFVITVTTYSFV